jgi:uncharacterized integral membrane protein
MARIIFSVVFLVAVAILIVMNIGSSAPVNVFGWKIDELSVTVVALVSFVAGVIYSFVFYLISYLERGRRDRLTRRKKKLQDQAAELKTREQEVGDLAQESRQQLETAQKMQEPAGSPNPGGARGAMAGLFGRRKGEKTRGKVTKREPT